jgi:hypothetical protein
MKKRKYSPKWCNSSATDGVKCHRTRIRCRKVGFAICRHCSHGRNATRRSALLLFTRPNPSLCSFVWRDPCVISVSRPPTLKLGPGRTQIVPDSVIPLFPGKPYINLIVVAPPSCIDLCRHVQSRRADCEKVHTNQIFRWQLYIRYRHQIEKLVV